MPEPPLVLQVSETLLGGVGRHVRDLLEGLEPSRLRQALVTSQRRVDARYLQGLACLVHRVDMRRLIRPGPDLAAYRSLLALLRRLRPALVHAHSSKAGFLARAAAGRLGIPAVYTPHIFPFQMPAAAPCRMLFVEFERWAARRCERIIVVSESERQAALRSRLCPPEKLVLIRNGLPPATAAAGPGRDYRQLLGLDPDAEVLLAVGDLRPQKNYPLLLAALARLAVSRPRLCCLIAGEGPERGRLERLRQRLGLETRVLLLGSREDIPALLGAADLVVMTSRYEGCSYALLEAQAAGVPTVAVEAPGVDEIVLPGRTGWLTPPQPEELAEALERVLEGSEPVAEIVAGARVRVREEFSLEHMLEATAALYEEILAGRSV